MRDHQCEDGDQVRVSVNGSVVFSGELVNAGDCQTVPVREGTNSVELFAINGSGFKGQCDYSDANSGEITIRGSSVSVETQTWLHPGGTGSRANLNVTVSPSAGSCQPSGDNQAPEPVASVVEGSGSVGETVTISIAELFTDPDGDTLTWTVQSDNTGVATASLTSDGLQIQGISAGAANIRVTASDPHGATASLVIIATVKPSGDDHNQAPEPVASVVEGSGSVGETVTISIAELFTDPDGDTLTWTAQSDNTGVATAGLTSDGLQIQGISAGVANIRVTASDPHGATASLVIIATVKPSGDEPPDPPDHPDTMAGATAIVAGQNVEGHIDSPDDVDFFELRLAETNAITVTITAESGIEIAILDADGNVLDTAETASEATLSLTASAGKFFLRVRDQAKKVIVGSAKKSYKFLTKRVDLKILENAENFINIIRGIPDYTLHVGVPGLGAEVGIDLTNHFVAGNGLPIGYHAKLSTGFKGVGLDIELKRDVLGISTAHGATPGPVQIVVTAKVLGLPLAWTTFTVNVQVAPNQPPRFKDPDLIEWRMEVARGETHRVDLRDWFEDEAKETLRFEHQVGNRDPGKGFTVSRDAGVLTISVADNASTGTSGYISIVIRAMDEAGETSSPEILRLYLLSSNPGRGDLPYDPSTFCGVGGVGEVEWYVAAEAIGDRCNAEGNSAAEPVYGNCLISGANSSTTCYRRFEEEWLRQTRACVAKTNWGSATVTEHSSSHEFYDEWVEFIATVDCGSYKKTWVITTVGLGLL